MRRAVYGMLIAISITVGWQTEKSRQISAYPDSCQSWTHRRVLDGGVSKGDQGDVQIEEGAGRWRTTGFAAVYDTGESPNASQLMFANLVERGDIEVDPGIRFSGHAPVSSRLFLSRGGDQLVEAAEEVFAVVGAG